MKIILDTNVFIRYQFDLKSPLLQFIYALRENDNQVIMPCIILDEVLQKYEETIEDKARKANNEIIAFNKLNRSNKLESISTEQVKESNEIFKSELLASFGENLLQYPVIAHKDLVDRLNKKQPPFEGDKGYKDALIWLSILDFSKSTQENIYFISNDKVFLNDTKSGLNSILLKEANDKGSNGRIKCFQSIEQFKKKIIDPGKKIIAEEYSKAIEDKKHPIDLADLIKSNQEEFITMPGLTALIPEADWNVDAIEAMTDLSVKRAIPFHRTERKLEENEFLIDFVGTFRFAISAEVSMGEEIKLMRNAFFGQLGTMPDFSSAFSPSFIQARGVLSLGQPHPHYRTITSDIVMKLDLRMIWSLEAPIKFEVAGAELFDQSKDLPI